MATIAATQPPSTRAQLHLATAAMVHDGALLIVRKRDTDTFIQPGGKIEPGEAPLDALVRELKEELGITIDPTQAEGLGEFTSPAAHDPTRDVVAHCYLLHWAEPFAVQAELVEYRWLPIHSVPSMAIAPLIEQQILPLLRRR